MLIKPRNNHKLHHGNHALANGIKRYFTRACVNRFPLCDLAFVAQSLLSYMYHYAGLSAKSHEPRQNSPADDLRYGSAIRVGNDALARGSRVN